MRIISLVILFMSFGIRAQEPAGLWVATVDVAKTCSGLEKSKEKLVPILIEKAGENKYSLTSRWGCGPRVKQTGQYLHKVFYAKDDKAILKMEMDNNLVGTRETGVNGLKAYTRIIKAIKMDPIKKDRKGTFTLVHKACTYVMSVDERGKQKNVLGLKREGSCSESINDYQEAVSALWDEARSQYQVTEFHTSLDHKLAVEEKFFYQLALVSGRDEEFQKVRKFGEKDLAVNHLMTRVIKENNLLQEFMKVHREIGFEISFFEADGVLRGKVSESPFYTELVKANLKGDDLIMTGAKSIHFKVH